MPGYKTVTGMGGTGSAADLAEMLRQMGRGRDTVLAHITPEEAQMLMQMGGSGTANPATGLPEFQPIGDYGFDLGSYEDISAASPMSDYEFDAYGPTADRTPSPSMMPTPQMDFQPYQPMDIGFGPDRFTPEYGAADIRGMAPEQFERFEAPQPSPFQRFAEGAEGGLQDIREKAAELSRQYPNISNLISSGVSSLPQLLAAARARREGRRAAEELRQLGAPLRQEAENLRQQAISGGLTPEQARQQEASRARLRQQAATRGATTGTQQAMIESQLQRTRSELGQANLQNALRQLNLANAYDEAAIKAALASDREVDDLLASVFESISAQMQGRKPQPRRQTPIQQPTPEITRRPELPRGQ